MQLNMLEIDNKITKSINRFLSWKENFGDVSYDRMDFWSSKTGKLAKRLYYKNKLLGAPFAFWGLLLENFLPGIQKIYAKPHREVIGDGHFASAYLNMYEITNEDKYLKNAEHFLNVMKTTATKGYTGLCWGYSFGWETADGYWASEVPLITITPYAFWAFKKHYKITTYDESKKIAISIADFALKDLKYTKMSNGTICSSYSPTKEDIIINANTYRATVLMEAYELTGQIKYLRAANKNLDFVLSYQGDNGEWYYEAKPPEDNFIDNFHTCFVLRNLYRCYLANKDEQLLKAITKGYRYYVENLFYESGRPKHFSKAKYVKLRMHEMYDYAEGITLGVLLKDDIPGALDKAKWLANDLIDNYQTKKGYFITRVTSLRTKHKVPYLRWPQAQLIYALTSLLKSIN